MICQTEIIGDEAIGGEHKVADKSSPTVRPYHCRELVSIGMTGDGRTVYMVGVNLGGRRFRPSCVHPVPVGNTQNDKN